MTSTPSTGDISGETPTLRIFSLLELIAAKDEFVTLQGLALESGLPKPTLHRMLRQLEDAGLLVRQSDGRHYGTGSRLRELAEDILLNAAQYGASHGVLRHLAETTGESCNLTALSGDEVVYLDRVETTAPLRFTLAVGSRAPVHASASGKVLLAQMPPAQRRRLLRHSPLPALTPATMTDPDDLEKSLRQVREQGWAIDDEEFLPGLVCIAVPVPSSRGRSNRCLAVQAPVMRVSAAEAPDLVEPLLKAAASIAAIESEGSTDTVTPHEEEVS